MRDTMTEFSFCDWFQKSAERKNQFSYEGLKALYYYLINLEEDTGEEFEFDPIAFFNILNSFRAATSSGLHLKM